MSLTSLLDQFNVCEQSLESILRVGPLGKALALLAHGRLDRKKACEGTNTLAYFENVAGKIVFCLCVRNVATK